MIVSSPKPIRRRLGGAILILLATAGIAPAAAADLRAPSAGADWYTGAPAQTVDDSWAIAVDGSTSVTSNSSAFGSITVTAPVAGSPTQSGPRVRVEAIAGTYSYPGQAVASRVTGYQEEGSVMAGYEWVWRDAALAGFIGFNARSNQLSIVDPGNPVVGTGVGLRVAANFYANPTDRTMVSAYGSYSTKFNAYYSRVRLGYMVADGVYIGPEALFLGDDFFRQYRIGAHLSGVKFGPVQMSLAAGFVQDRVQGSGYYSSIEARANF
ncbi:cellulose biosynthesis protein BcsS [Methylobacterium terrae]|uniref:Cellulose biosynthesis protein BcsS n=1 Tax=Methylobacterium terrae TaxID=2202827 RepID=A0A2U8WVU0_9HYPH|nr:cellulose biosynthesis protein BcsS [Methylobacterium terrae]